MQLSIREKRLARSVGGDVAAFFFLFLAASFTALPIVFAISNAFKPLSELFLFPPTLIVRHPTLANFQDLFGLMAQSWVPMARYFLNSLIIVAFGTIGNVLAASMAAFILSTRKFIGANLFMGMVVLSLMFASEVTAIPNYIIIARLGWIDTYASVIVPAWGSTLGLYLMKKFIDAMVDDSLLEAARIDGASEFRTYWSVVMPIVRPAWLTMIILLFQALWGTTGGNFIYSEQLKTLPHALNQIVQGGVARQGVGAAVTVIMMILPISVFIYNQSKIIQTMGTSGMAN
jgi:ABC-type glycerol-3-phosphate transport system permease component